MMYKIKLFIQRIKRLWKYIPMIWKSYDFDYGYTEDILREKLRDLMVCMAKDESMYIDENYYKLKSIKIAISILDRRHNRWYTEYWRRNQIGDYELRWKFTGEYFEGEESWDVYTNETKEEGEYNYALLKASEECEKRDWRIFCSILNQYFNTWWT